MNEELTQDQRGALARFKVAKGRCWKSHLRALWASGGDERHEDGAVLRQIRNCVGPCGLDRVKI